ncbi:hypothetical protein OROHE_023541 [Orobanche hederae]
MDIAIKSIDPQPVMPVAKLFADISEEPVTAASLGQIYKLTCTLESCSHQNSEAWYVPFVNLNALLFNMIGGQLQRFAKARKDLLVPVNNLVRHKFDETDYILEGQNAERFAALYGCTPLIGGNIFERHCSTAASYWHQA